MTYYRWGINIRQKNAADWAALKEGYKTLISKKEVCISRVAAIVMTKANGWNVAYCRVTDCRRVRAFLVIHYSTLQNHLVIVLRLLMLGLCPGR